MNKLEKLLAELVKISYANLQFNILLTRTVVGAIATMNNTTDGYDKEMENAYKTIDRYVNSLNKEMEASNVKPFI